MAKLVFISTFSHHNFTMKSIILTGLLLANGIAGHVIRRHSQQFDLACQVTGKAVYLLTNDAENSVVALPINEDGTLAAGTVTPSGGKGSNSIDGTTMGPAQPDALVSQSALTIAGSVSFTCHFHLIVC